LLADFDNFTQTVGYTTKSHFSLPHMKFLQVRVLGLGLNSHSQHAVVHLNGLDKGDKE